MNYNAALTRVSSNVKTGPIATSMTTKETCPNSCPLKERGCYAAGGPAAIHWRKVTNGERGKAWEEFCEDVANLPRGQLFRHNVAGDLPGDGEQIDAGALAMLARAAKRIKGFTYTHYQAWNQNNGTHAANAAAIYAANENGFTVNLSANNVEQALAFKALDIAPVVTLLPMDAPNVQTVQGIKVVACPAEKSDKVTCANCALCADAKREYIIGFRAHGVSKKAVEIIAKG